LTPPKKWSYFKLVIRFAFLSFVALGRVHLVGDGKRFNALFSTCEALWFIRSAGVCHRCLQSASSSSIRAIKRTGDRNVLARSRLNISGKSIQPRAAALSNTDHFQPWLPGVNSSVPIVHQEELSGLFQRERDCFRLAVGQTGGPCGHRRLKIHHFQPSWWIGNSGTHGNRCISMRQFLPDGSRDQKHG